MLNKPRDKRLSYWTVQIFTSAERFIGQCWSRILLTFYQIISVNVLLLTTDLGGGVSFLLTPSCCFPNTSTPTFGTTLAPLTNPLAAVTSTQSSPLVSSSFWNLVQSLSTITLAWSSTYEGEHLINLGSMTTLSLLTFPLLHFRHPLYVPGTFSPGTLHNSEILNSSIPVSDHRLLPIQLSHSLTPTTHFFSSFSYPCCFHFLHY